MESPSTHSLTFVLFGRLPEKKRKRLVAAADYEEVDHFFLTRMIIFHC
jgi:hypothetical protein